CGAPPPPQPQPTPTSVNVMKPAPIDIQAIGRGHVESLAAGRPGEVWAHFDSTMKGAMSEAQLAELWPGLTAQVGSLKQLVGTRTERRDQLEAVIVTCQFENALLEVRVVFDPERKIAGLFVRPADQAAAYETPSYAQLDTVDEIELSVGEDDW